MVCLSVCLSVDLSVFLFMYSRDRVTENATILIHKTYAWLRYLRLGIYSVHPLGDVTPLQSSSKRIGYLQTYIIHVRRFW